MKFFDKIWEKIKALLKQGLTPKQLALSLVVSTLVSLFPVFGITTIVLTLIAIPLRLNLPIMIAFSYVGDSLKFLLLIPFIKIGARILGTEHTLLTFEAIKASYQADFWQTAKDLTLRITLWHCRLGIDSYSCGPHTLFFIESGFYIYRKTEKQPVIHQIKYISASARLHLHYLKWFRPTSVTSAVPVQVHSYGKSPDFCIFNVRSSCCATFD